MDLFIVDVPAGALLRRSYSPWLVVLSYLVATGGCALALYVANGAAKSTNPRSKEILMLAGATAFGLSVWSMHFIGMLAMSLCTSVSYDTLVTFLSALPAIAAAWVALRWISMKKLGPGQILMGGLIAGAGIGLMHYSGMMAMQMNAQLSFDPIDFAISIIAAVALASVALWVRNGLQARTHWRPLHVDFLSMLIMGLAITTMHYLGMHAARFVGQADTVVPVPPSDWILLATLIVIGIASMLGFAATGVLLTRLRDSLAEIRVQRQEMEAIIQSSTEAIVIANAEGVIKNVNKAFQHIFACDAGQASGKDLSDFLPQWSALLARDQPHTLHESNGMRDDGRAFPVSVAYTRLVIDGLTIYVGFVSDQSDMKRVQELLQHEASHDFLTGLNNRRYFDDQLHIEMERSRRSGLPLSLLMLDIDHFKRINDTYGHIAGDRALEGLASELKRQARAGDVLSRFGGEEFVLLMPNKSEINAKSMAERLRKAVEGLGISHEGTKLRFTVSVGVSSADDCQGLPPEALLAAADKALYAAKESGRNRVELGQIVRAQQPLMP